MPNLFAEQPVRPPSNPIESRPMIVVQRRLSTNSLEIFIDEIYQSLLDPLIIETTNEIYDEFVTQWNERIGRTCRIFNEFLHDEIVSIVNECFIEGNFHQRMIDETRREQNERQREKYLRRKYFSIWFNKYLDAKDERRILKEFQDQYHFVSYEQLLEFLIGLQLIDEECLSIDETISKLKYRRWIKEKHQREIFFISQRFFDEFLDEEFRSLIIESNDEIRQREILLQNALKRQNQRQREHFLQMKFFSIWLRKFRQRKEIIRDKSTKKRFYSSISNRTNKKFKDQHEQFENIKTSFEQLTDDLKKIQTFVDRLISSK